MRGIFAIVVAAAVLCGCQAPEPSASRWRASDEGGDGPGIGYELWAAGQGYAGNFYVMSADHPMDFSAASSVRMVYLGHTQGALRFRIPLKREEPSTMLITVPPEPWPDSFQAVATEVLGDTKGEPETFEFTRVRP
ncbi:MAG TPA: hypothetical protein VGG34_05595 [Opitutaceae bacterium]|jgi:hypothetical protein